MASLFIKGTVMGISPEDCLNNPDYLSSTLLTLLQNWREEHYNRDGTYRLPLSDLTKKRYGEVKQSLVAVENDFHNLSIAYHQIMFVKDAQIEAGLKELYISNLTESYFTNIRSIYDHIACFPRILVDEYNLTYKMSKTTSFNELLGFCDKANPEKRVKAEKIYSCNLLNIIEQCKSDFNAVKTIRDAIIHDGKEPVVSLTQEHGLSFRIPIHVGNYGAADLLPDILGRGEASYPLLEYMRQVTVDLFGHMEQIGDCMGNLYISKQPTESSYLYGLIGICIKDFVEFLFPDGKQPLLMCS